MNMQCLAVTIWCQFYEVSSTECSEPNNSRQREQRACAALYMNHSIAPSVYTVKPAYYNCSVARSIRYRSVVPHQTVLEFWNGRSGGRFNNSKGPFCIISEHCTKRCEPVLTALYPVDWSLEFMDRLGKKRYKTITSPVLNMSRMSDTISCFRRSYRDVWTMEASKNADYSLSLKLPNFYLLEKLQSHPVVALKV